MSVLILSDSDDAHVPFVQAHLTNAPIIIGSKSLIEGGELTYEIGKNLTIIVEGKQLTNITGAWYRKPYWAADSIILPEEYKEYSYFSLKRHLGVLSVCLPKVKWVSDYSAILKAEYKPMQLTLAKQIGFNIPETIFTSESSKAEHFLKTHNFSIIKSPAPVNITKYKSKKGHVLCSRLVSKDDYINLDGLNLAPAIFQEAIETKLDIRVNVVGDKVFATSIKSDNTNAKVRDWRMCIFSDKLEYDIFKLPESIADKCIQFVKKLNLEFGAIDLVLDKKGIIWFLEINPNGQWAFVEEQTGQPIGKAIAELLEKPKP